MSEPDPELLTFMNTRHAVVRHYGKMFDGVAWFTERDGRFGIAMQTRDEFCKAYSNKPGPKGHKNIARFWLSLPPVHARTYIWLQYLPGDRRADIRLGSGGEPHVYICNVARYLSPLDFTEPPEPRETIGWRTRLKRWS